MLFFIAIIIIIIAHSNILNVQYQFLMEIYKAYKETRIYNTFREGKKKLTVNIPEETKALDLLHIDFNCLKWAQGA